MEKGTRPNQHPNNLLYHIVILDIYEHTCYKEIKNYNVKTQGNMRYISQLTVYAFNWK